MDRDTDDNNEEEYSDEQYELDPYLLSHGHFFSNENMISYEDTQKLFLMVRAKIIDWLYALNKAYHYDKETLFQTVKLIDIFLSKYDIPINDKQIQLFTSIAFLITSKICEVDTLTLRMVEEGILKKKFPTQTLIETEQLICKTVNFKIKRENIQTYVNYYINDIMKKESDSIIINYISEVTFGFNIIFIETPVFNFEFATVSLSFLSIKYTLRFLLYCKILNNEQFIKFNNVVKECLGEKNYSDLESKYSITYGLIDKLIYKSEKNFRKKPYLQKFLELYDKYNYKDKIIQDEENRLKMGQK